MRVHILGSAAGGGFPQWNCNCKNCYGVRRGSIKAAPRTPLSVAVSTDNENWVLLNVSPDIHGQLENFKEMLPRRGLRDTGVKALLLVDSGIDNMAGLLMLREGCPLPLYSTERVKQDLTDGFPVMTVLKSCQGGVVWHRIDLDDAFFQIPKINGLRFQAVPLTGQVAPYWRDENPSDEGREAAPGDYIGLYIEDMIAGSSLFYAPKLAAVDQKVHALMGKSDCLLLDGAFWSEDEMIVAGVGTKLANELGHLPQSGDGGMIQQLQPYTRQRKILVNMNNTNPILIDDAEERALLCAQGIEVAYDGMDFEIGAQAALTRLSKHKSRAS